MLLGAELYGQGAGKVFFIGTASSFSPFLLPPFPFLTPFSTLIPFSYPLPLDVGPYTPLLFLQVTFPSVYSLPCPLLPPTLFPLEVGSLNPARESGTAL